MAKLNTSKNAKLFSKSKIILKTAFFYVKMHINETNNFIKNKNIIVISKKCGIAVKRNYLRRITKSLIHKYLSKNEKINYLFIFLKKNLNYINYKILEKEFLELIKNKNV